MGAEAVIYLFLIFRFDFLKASEGKISGKTTKTHILPQFRNVG
jgi:hypothetical protein